MKPESLTPEDIQARLEFFKEEKSIGERHSTFADGQIEKCTLFLMGQLQFEFPN